MPNESIYTGMIGGQRPMEQSVGTVVATHGNAEKSMCSESNFLLIDLRDP